MTQVMFDTTTVDSVPSNAQIVAGYTSGFWPTYLPLVQKFPHAKHLSIAIFQTHDADALDIENGDAVPASAPEWVNRQRQRGIKTPVVYAAVSAMPWVQVELHKAGIPRSAYKIWTAHYGAGEHICGPQCGFGFVDHADGTQWTSTAFGRNLDQSLLKDDFFWVAPPAPVPPKPDPYRLFSKDHYQVGNGPREIVEYDTVKKFDALYEHRHLHPKEFNAVQADVAFLRDRVWLDTFMDGRLANGKFDWDKENRGFRYHWLSQKAPKDVRPATR